MNAPEQSTASSTAETAGFFQPIDHAQMVLLPFLLLFGVGSLFFGPGTPPGNAALPAVLLVLTVVIGKQLYQKWDAIS